MLRFQGQLWIGATLVAAKVHCILQQSPPLVVLGEFYAMIIKDPLKLSKKHLLQDVWVAHHNHQCACSRHRHVEPLRVRQETQLVRCVHCQELV